MKSYDNSGKLVGEINHFRTVVLSARTSRLQSPLAR
jgi:hypothetical protein